MFVATEASSYKGASGMNSLLDTGSEPVMLSYVELVSAVMSLAVHLGLDE